ncbi:MAG TPA: RCC1 repeat-containing protein [Candidatus Bathyarchaeia archaeon]|nr:RCC1 repeat-containing protein [Candidatus Bathyarchaeia archaeon]
MSQNSLLLNSQYYNMIANEAAQSGAAAAVKCIATGAYDWDTSGKSKLAPQTDCHGNNVAGRPTVVVDYGTVQTTYTVSALQNPYSNNLRIIQATGTATLKDSMGRTITLASKTTSTIGRLQAQIPTGVTSISAGYGTVCAVSDGQPWCWGFNGDGQLGNNSLTDSYTPTQVDTTGVLAGKTMTSMATGYDYTCGIANGAAYCWGYGVYGNNGNGSTAEIHAPAAVSTSGVLSGKTVTAISSSDNKYVCAVASGAAYCWGYNANGQLGNNTTTQANSPVAVYSAGVLSGKTVTAISVGQYHSCAIASGQAYCWGNNNYGMLGNNTTTQSLIPVAVNTTGVLAGKTVTAISAGKWDTCVIADGKPYCWGDNTYGQLGNNSTTGSLVPVAVNTAGVLNGKTATAIGSTLFNACTVADGKAYCWGHNSTGELGNGTPATDSTVPVAVDTSGVLNGLTVTDITTNDYGEECAIANGNSYCWGFNPNGEVGNGSQTDQYVPVQSQGIGIFGGPAVTSVASGWENSCAVANGKVYCWGDNSYGQLGNNSTISSLVPVAVDTSGVLSGKTITAVSAGVFGACAIASGQVYCWGWNNYGQLGNGTTTDAHVPVAVNTSGVLNGKTVTAISVGYWSTCAIASGQSYCWGYNNDGELGNNSTTASTVPVATYTAGVLSGKTVTAISQADNGWQTCAVASGAAYCWGYNNDGQLGNNSLTTSLVPVAVYTAGVLSGKTITAISTGDFHTCVIASGKAYCWGYNNDGQLGNNSVTDSKVPVAVTATGVLSGLTVTDISSSGNFHTCAVANGQAYCWGNDNSGQLGNNSYSNSSVPVAVNTTGALNNQAVTSIYTAGAHSCATANSQAYCWGYDPDGELGNNGTANQPLAVAVTSLGSYPSIFAYNNAASY